MSLWSLLTGSSDDEVTFTEHHGYEEDTVQHHGYIIEDRSGSSIVSAEDGNRYIVENENLEPRGFWGRLFG